MSGHKATPRWRPNVGKAAKYGICETCGRRVLLVRNGKAAPHWRHRPDARTAA